MDSACTLWTDRHPLTLKAKGQGWRLVGTWRKNGFCWNATSLINSGLLLPGLFLVKANEAISNGFKPFTSNPNSVKASVSKLLLEVNISLGNKIKVRKLSVLSVRFLLKADLLSRTVISELGTWQKVFFCFLEKSLSCIVSKRYFSEEFLWAASNATWIPLKVLWGGFRGHKRHVLFPKHWHVAKSLLNVAKLETNGFAFKCQLVCLSVIFYVPLNCTSDLQLCPSTTNCLCNLGAKTGREVRQGCGKTGFTQIACCALAG